jgi:uncharacterized protein YceK
MVARVITTTTTREGCATVIKEDSKTKGKEKSRINSSSGGSF